MATEERRGGRSCETLALKKILDKDTLHSAAGRVLAACAIHVLSCVLVTMLSVACGLPVPSTSVQCLYSQ